MNDRKNPKPPDQAQKFKDAARDLEADEDEARWEERLKRLGNAKPPAEER